MTGPIELVWPDCLNVRDLGGLPASGGRQTRRGALIRSDNLTRLNGAGIQAVRAASVSRIVDVRTPRECDGDPSPFATETLYHNLPLSKPGDPYDPALTIDQQYVAMLDLNPDLFAAAIGAIADAPPGAVVVHCHAGKDRAGTVVALALSLAGVSADSIAAEYAVLSNRMHEHFANQLADVDDAVKRRQLAESFSALPATMLTALQHLDDSYGGVRSYLRHGGLTTPKVNALRDRLVI